MKLSPWRKCAIGILSVALINMGVSGVASATIVDTATLVAVDREADLNLVRGQLDRADVRAQMEKMGMDASAVDRRIANLNDRELHRLAADLQNAPAGGDVLAVIGAVFVVLLILELVGVIDIFKKTAPAH